MKKLIVLFTLLLLFTGCEIKDITNSDIDKLVTETVNLEEQINISKDISIIFLEVLALQIRKVIIMFYYQMETTIIYMQILFLIFIRYKIKI